MYLFLLKKPPCSSMTVDFTFHNVSISTHILQSFLILIWHLYIPQCIYFYADGIKDGTTKSCFTFHNVSISTRPFDEDGQHRTYFTFHNVSISTGLSLKWKTAIYYFTFHNVSISTNIFLTLPICSSPLHSTMYLFLRGCL